MTPNGRNHFEDWDLFALGALDDPQQRAMAEHLASGCEECLQLFLAAEAGAAGLATLSPDETLPPGAEIRMRKRLESAGAPSATSTAQSSHRPPFRPWTIAPWVLAAACLLVAIGLGVNLAHTRGEVRKFEQQNADYLEHIQRETPVASGNSEEITPTRVAELRTTMDGLQRDLKRAQAAQAMAERDVKTAQTQLAEAQARVRELDASLKDADARRTKAEEALSSAHLQLAKAQSDADTLAQIARQNDQIVRLLEAAPLNQLDLKPAGTASASARVFWHDDQGLLLVARDLPRLPQHGSFQLWFYRKGTPEVVNVGVVQLGASGNGLLFVPPGPALLSMTGALLTEESGTASAASPGEEILKVKP